MVPTFFCQLISWKFLSQCPKLDDGVAAGRYLKRIDLGWFQMENLFFVKKVISCQRAKSDSWVVLTLSARSDYIWWYVKIFYLPARIKFLVGGRKSFILFSITLFSQLTDDGGYRSSSKDEKTWNIIILNFLLDNTKKLVLILLVKMDDEDSLLAHFLSL